MISNEPPKHPNSSYSFNCVITSVVDIDECGYGRACFSEKLGLTDILRGLTESAWSDGQSREV